MNEQYEKIINCRCGLQHTKTSCGWNWLLETWQCQRCRVILYFDGRPYRDINYIECTSCKFKQRLCFLTNIPIPMKCMRCHSLDVSITKEKEQQTSGLIPELIKQCPTT